MAENKGRCVGYFGKKPILPEIAYFPSTVHLIAPFLIKDCNTSILSERLEIGYKESSNRAEVLYQLLSFFKFSYFWEIEDLGDYMLPDIRGDCAQTTSSVSHVCRSSPNRGDSDVLCKHPTHFLISNERV
jgi:hypothetical protein